MRSWSSEITAVQRSGLGHHFLRVFRKRAPQRPPCGYVFGVADGSDVLAEKRSGLAPEVAESPVDPPVRPVQGDSHALEQVNLHDLVGGVEPSQLEEEEVKYGR